MKPVKPRTEGFLCPHVRPARRAGRGGGGGGVPCDTRHHHLSNIPDVNYALPARPQDASATRSIAILFQAVAGAAPPLCRAIDVEA
ncbi:hypothetical protein J6590_003958 [Homalodisca vitripennis]|nr:hypothetical protein J6590_003958 [Homalodisca vitripennis]